MVYENIMAKAAASSGGRQYQALAWRHRRQHGISSMAAWRSSVASSGMAKRRGGGGNIKQ